MAKASRTSSSVCRSRQTPRPWLPSSGLTTTGYPIRRAAATAPVGGAHRLLLGHGQPGGRRAAAWSCPCRRRCRRPARRSWTSSWRGSAARGRPGRAARATAAVEADVGDVAATASSRIAPVDGPNAVRWARRRNRSSSSAKSNPSSAWTRWLTSRTASVPAARPTVLVGVVVDDVVDARAALDRAGLAAAQVVAGLLLQLQRDVLGDVTEPGALAQPLDEAALHARASRCGSPGPGSSSTSRSVNPASVSVG